MPEATTSFFTFTDMTQPSRLTISNDFLEAEIAPQLGGRLCRLRALNDGIDLVVPLGPWDAPEHGWPKAGAYPLIPYSNRIRDARLTFQNQIHALAPHPLDRPNALHGHTQRCAWQVVMTSSQRAELTLHSAPNADWPWSFESQMVFDLVNNTLIVSLGIANHSEHTMPAGIGWHPFFATDTQTTIRFLAKRQWELDEKYLPTGRSSTVTAPDELSRKDWAARDFVRYVSEWDGAALIERDAGTLRLTTDEPLTHLVAFAARSAKFICLEPVSHVADGFNLAAEGIEGSGMRVLEPGELLAGRITLSWESKA